ncbi:hypothetical protein C8R41DRAFT_853620 [Lentinula lateritia]|uniref:HIT-type domain-containing protein n=1 Tax=Lentinula lateritia TaxID=40482 RepID=A0ABQ8V788_9AGAR|nr:hypothetical protein C8R41DRAFT_853620 [Lentinula lateritia]
MQSGNTVRPSHKRDHSRTLSLLSQPCLNPIDAASGFATPIITELAHGSFTPTSPALPCLMTLATFNTPGSIFMRVSHSRRRQNSISEWPEMHSQSGASETSSIPPSPTSLSRSSRAPSIPRITRTSSYDTHSSVSSSPSLLDETFLPARLKTTEMNPIFSELERRSKLCTSVVGCATCGKYGSDYPRCGKCGEMWCSRPCRLRGGRKHLCTLRS